MTVCVYHHPCPESSYVYVLCSYEDEYQKKTELENEFVINKKVTRFPPPPSHCSSIHKFLSCVTSISPCLCVLRTWMRDTWLQ